MKRFLFVLILVLIATGSGGFALGAASAGLVGGLRASAGLVGGARAYVGAGRSRDVVLRVRAAAHVRDEVGGRARGDGRSRRSHGPRGVHGAIETFTEAKKVAHSVHDSFPLTIYCGCRYQANKIDLGSCGYKVYKNAARASRLEWEHVVPAEAFGQSFVEWREGDPRCVRRGRKFHGRKCAEKNHDFNLMESDLYNLWPEDGELNGMRSNFSMAEISGPALSFGGCSAKIADRKFEPMDLAKGTVARVYMYMDQAYPGRGIISNKNRPLFAAWDRAHPVSPRECTVGRRVFDLQHRANPVLALRCKGQAGW